MSLKRQTALQFITKLTPQIFRRKHRKLQISANGYSETGRQTTRLYMWGLRCMYPTAAPNPFPGNSLSTEAYVPLQAKPIQEVKKTDWVKRRYGCLSRCNTTSNS